MPPQRKSKVRTGALIICFLAIVVPLAVYYRSNPDVRTFDAIVNDVAIDPQRWIGKQIGISTSPLEERLFGPRVTSGAVNLHLVRAYETLASHLEPEPVTYFATIAGMPTQETIWQYSDYFIRLYVTSSLDCDGADIGAFAGSYMDFRHPEVGIQPIKFLPPSRFLADR